MHLETKFQIITEIKIWKLVLQIVLNCQSTLHVDCFIITNKCIFSWKCKTMPKVKINVILPLGVGSVTCNLRTLKTRQLAELWCQLWSTAVSLRLSPFMLILPSQGCFETKFGTYCVLPTALSKLGSNCLELHCLILEFKNMEMGKCLTVTVFSDSWLPKSICFLIGKGTCEGGWPKVGEWEQEDCSCMITSWRTLSNQNWQLQNWGESKFVISCLQSFLWRAAWKVSGSWGSRL